MEQQLNQVPNKMRIRLTEIALEITQINRKRTPNGYEISVKGIDKQGKPFYLIGSES